MILLCPPRSGVVSAPTLEGSTSSASNPMCLRQIDASPRQDVPIHGAKPVREEEHPGHSWRIDLAAQALGSASGRGPFARAGPATAMITATSANFAAAASRGSAKPPA